MKIDLHIEHVVLHGLPSVNGRAMGGALERELARILVERGLPRAALTSSVRHRLDGGAARIQAGTTDQVLGRQVARNVYGVLKS